MKYQLYRNVFLKISADLQSGGCAKTPGVFRGTPAGVPRAELRSATQPPPTSLSGPKKKHIRLKFRRMHLSSFLFCSCGFSLGSVFSNNLCNIIHKLAVELELLGKDNKSNKEEYRRNNGKHNWNSKFCTFGVSIMQ